MLFFRKGKAKPINDYTSRDNVKVIMPKQSTGKVHITQKPHDFTLKLITNSSNKSELVLDPFSGGGTVAVCCIDSERNYIAFESDKENYEKSLIRVDKHNSK